jgi:nitroimidazol reductase NimA-like FMN-containing flavoprotein (pyridoxamine 5'-phosphate oxidase superfamily)
MHTIEERTGLEVLDDNECQLLLGRATVGRLAAVVDGRPSIFPVNFRRHGGAVVFRSDEGTKLDAAAREQPVAFEVDEVDSRERSGWSIVIRGTGTEVVDPDELEAVRKLPLHPWAQGVKSHYVRIVPDEISGRRIVRNADTLYRR